MEKEINRVKGLPVMKRKKEKAQEVVIVDIEMKFWSVVWLMVQWSIASIPAFIILMILIMLFGAMLATITQVF